MTAKGWIGVILALLCVASVTARIVLDDGDEAAAPVGSGGAESSGGRTSFLPDGTPKPSTTPPEEKDGVEGALPMISEASFFALIGFALGYFARKVVKLGLILLAVFFIGVQGLSYLGVIDVNWDRALEVLNDFVLNLKENETIGEILKDRIPTAGALVAGYWLGFRKG